MTNSPSSLTDTNAPEGLRDIVDAVPVTSLAAELLFWGTLAAILAALALVARWWWRRRQRLLNTPPPPPPPIPPHERARRRLEAALAWLGDPDRFCTEVSAALREYLEGRFGWNAPDRTTEEFLAELRTREGLSESIQALLQDFLTRCDYVKFARYDPTEPELRDLHRSAVRMVEDTVPPPTPVAAPPTSGPSAPNSPPSSPA